MSPLEYIVGNLDCYGYEEVLETIMGPFKSWSRLRLSTTTPNNALVISNSGLVAAKPPFGLAESFNIIEHMWEKLGQSLKTKKAANAHEKLKQLEEKSKNIRKLDRFYASNVLESNWSTEYQVNHCISL